MQTFRSILSALGIVAVIFGVPVLATLAAGQLGLSFRVIGWFTLLAMIVMAFQFRGSIGRLLMGNRLAPALARRARRLR